MHQDGLKTTSSLASTTAIQAAQENLENLNWKVDGKWAIYMLARWVIVLQRVCQVFVRGGNLLKKYQKKRLSHTYPPHPKKTNATDPKTWPVSPSGFVQQGKESDEEVEVLHHHA